MQVYPFVLWWIRPCQRRPLLPLLRFLTPTTSTCFPRHFSYILRAPPNLKSQILIPFISGESGSKAGKRGRAKTRAQFGSPPNLTTASSLGIPFLSLIHISINPSMESNDIEEEEFGFSRNYFLAKELKSSTKKSARKVSDVNIVDEQELRDAYAKLETKHDKEINDLVRSYKDLYTEWVYTLRCGFGLLMYGFGSKKALIEDFASTALTDYSVIVINGYLQSINLKQVAVTLAELLWDQLKMKVKNTSASNPKNQQPFNTRSMGDLILFLDGPHLEDEECFVCVVVNNIDGPGLRDPESQQYLARLAACSHVLMVASIDHVNAPLLWDKKMVHTQFNWYWYHVPTYAHYKVEGTFFPLILAHSGSIQTVKTASIVLQSLTPNAQSVFNVIAEHQLSHPDDEGMALNNLYTICRERFLVSSQITLNAHLTEFKDHELVKTRRNSDGEDCLYIPLTSDALQKLVQEITQ